jgi:hypothetical protein
MVNVGLGLRRLRPHAPADLGAGVGREAQHGRPAAIATPPIARKAKRRSASARYVPPRPASDRFRERGGSAGLTPGRAVASVDASMSAALWSQGR